MRASGIDKSATTKRVRLAEVDAKAQADSDSDSFVIKTESTVGDRESVKPVTSVGCRNCKHSRTVVIIRCPSQYCGRVDGENQLVPRLLLES